MPVFAKRYPTGLEILMGRSEAFPFDEAPRQLIRDRDGAYGPAYTRRIRAMGIRDRPTAPRSPWQNGHVERLIGPIRRESLDHLVVFGEAHLRDVLKAYASYYNKVRPHISLDKDAPDFRRTQKIGRIAAIPILGGLHHQYVRISVLISDGSFQWHTDRMSGNVVVEPSDADRGSFPPHPIAPFRQRRHARRGLLGPEIKPSLAHNDPGEG